MKKVVCIRLFWMMFDLTVLLLGLLTENRYASFDESLVSIGTHLVLLLCKLIPEIDSRSSRRGCRELGHLLLALACHA